MNARYDCGWSGARPTYSSSRNARVLPKLTRPARWRSTSSAYAPSGELPVASPSTQTSPCPTSRAIASAAMRFASAAVAAITTSIAVSARYEADRVRRGMDCADRAEQDGRPDDLDPTSQVEAAQE